MSWTCCALMAPCVGSAETSWSYVCWDTCHGHLVWDECATSQGNLAMFSALTLHKLRWRCMGAHWLPGKEEPVGLLMPVCMWSYRCHGQRKTGGGGEGKYLGVF